MYTSYVHHMCIVLSSGVHHVCIMCSSGVHCVYIMCSSGVHHVCIMCSSGVHHVLGTCVHHHIITVLFHFEVSRTRNELCYINLYMYCIHIIIILYSLYTVRMFNLNCTYIVWYTYCCLPPGVGTSAITSL